ncbi:hypothetical protein pipiens_020345, partial [Culex pipiens pipiens]
MSYAKDHSGMYIAYVSLFLVALLLFGKTIYYCTLKVSTVDGPI